MWISRWPWQAPQSKDARPAQKPTPFLCCAQCCGWACQPVLYKLVKPGSSPHVFRSLGPSLTSQSRCYLVCLAWKPDQCGCSSNLVTNIRETGELPWRADAMLRLYDEIRNAPPAWPPAPCPQPSAQLADLLTGMFAKEPADRPTMQAIMQHPWMVADGLRPLKSLQASTLFCWALRPCARIKPFGLACEPGPLQTVHLHMPSQVHGACISPFHSPQSGPFQWLLCGNIVHPRTFQ